jgi:hypothetical protein
MPFPELRRVSTDKTGFPKITALSLEGLTVFFYVSYRKGFELPLHHLHGQIEIFENYFR